ncbi:MAG TPA: quinolinate synthase NadA [Gammaproteobacteria bacterium]|nr:quinolinate synthase NadA [Gammaproteobacteria bacterium]
MTAAALKIDDFALLEDEACDARIRAAKAKLAGKAVILGHHYQREEVYRHADLTGDSLKLAQHAARVEAPYIVFCGVHFMAEVADILSRPDQISILPDMAAGCSMADMANLANVERAWRELAEVFGDPDEVVTPITYVNSAADLKAFCGRHGGIVCTSTNARKILEWAFARREKVLFFPDQHLGRNTAYRMGIPLEDMAVWDYDKPLGGLAPETIRRVKVLLWKGFCSVHQMFRPEHIDQFKAKYPDAKVISHPECAFEVCQKSDLIGSTEFIQTTIRNAAPGTRWLVGTELNLVNRLHEEVKHKGVNVHFMSPMVCMCSTMFRIDPQHLAWTLENLVAGNVVNQIKVPEPVATEARRALDAMMEISTKD